MPKESPWIQHLTESIKLSICSECEERPSWCYDRVLGGYAVKCGCRHGHPGFRDGVHDSRDEMKESWNNLNADMPVFNDEHLPDLSDFEDGA